MKNGMLRTAASGFTLIELLITVALVGIVSMATVPALSDFLRNAALRSAAHHLMGSLTSARSEAVKRGGRAVLCASAAPLATVPACDGSPDDWSTGWIVFVDADGDAAFTDGTDVLLGVGSGVGHGIELLANVAASTLVFRPDGTLAANSTARFVLCDARGAPFGRQLNVTRVGRPDLRAGTADNPLASCTPA
jgi:type IV fimbrial biogenesis protein FimT